MGRRSCNIKEEAKTIIAQDCGGLRIYVITKNSLCCIMYILQKKSFNFNQKIKFFFLRRKNRILLLNIISWKPKNEKRGDNNAPGLLFIWIEKLLYYINVILTVTITILSLTFYIKNIASYITSSYFVPYLTSYARDRGPNSGPF